MFRIPQLLALCILGTFLAIPAAVGQSTSLRVQVVDERGVPVRNAVVELEPAGGWSGTVRFPWRMAMAQKNETFVPGTLVIASGSTVAFPNLDRVRHSIYSFSKPARFEIDLYGRDQTRSHRFPVAGSVKLGCNIHDDMRGYIRVTDTPFAGKTDANGYITLNGMPSGTGKLTVWHPLLRAPGNETVSTVSVRGSGKSERIKVRLR
ncbi:methylamine utilization protein [Erythrobacter sp. GH1-10]|uniref:methylamine utilization protein n=1 Tax=Erythrobacter sp. GH1-10 TaxID=3349334 RepID=UPI003878277D